MGEAAFLKGASMFDRQLAKWHLEQLGYLAAIDVNLGDQGTADVLGVKTGPGSGAVLGVVRGWWHTGAYLTPSLIRNHLQTERKLLDRGFAPDRLAQAATQFGMERLPEKVLFYSKRSPSLAAEAEEDLQLLGIRVVYLEDILAAALAEANYEDRVGGTIFGVLAMVKTSRIFKEMARLARQAERRNAAETKVKPAAAAAQTDAQLDLLLALPEEEDGDETAAE
jgi:uncharacterized protein YdbL (DUF1318 family)